MEQILSINDNRTQARQLMEISDISLICQYEPEIPFPSEEHTITIYRELYRMSKRIVVSEKVCEFYGYLVPYPDTPIGQK